jgi:Rrf2 family cysteine metabolism transcriptional repressor
MRLSTKGRYSARTMLDLALHFGEGPVLVKDISERQRISRGYLQQLFIPLRSAGLVKSTRGASGGFTLARPPSEIWLTEIMQVTEGSTAPVPCVDEPGLCTQSNECTTREVWVEMKRACDSLLDSITLQDLVDRHRKRCAGYSEELESERRIGF